MTADSHMISTLAERRYSKLHQYRTLIHRIPMYLADESHVRQAIETAGSSRSPLANR